MEINLQQFLLQIVNFGIVFFVLSKFAYKPILKILDERANKISDGLRAAEKSLQEQIKIEQTKQKELAKTQKEAAKILEEANKKAEGLSKEMIEQAKAESKKVIQNEEKQLMARLEKEEKRLKGEVASLVSETTQAVLKTGLSAKHQKEILKNQINDLKKLKVK
ncbi:F0F1 ATP synthase subunit B [Patescibacteria group bacterium]